MSSELEPVYLLTGGDRPKIARALRRLRAHVAGDATESLSATEASGADVVAACNALGLFGAEGRLVIVHGVDSWKPVDVKAIAAYVRDPAPDTVLALVAEQVKADSPLAKACAQAGQVLAFDVSRGQLPRWVREQFARLGTEADAAACRALLELVGDDLESLAGEIDKLATWAAGDRVSARDVEALVVAPADSSPFALTDAWGRRDVPAVLAACESLLERSGEPRARTLPRIAGVLNGHVARVRAAAALTAEGVRPREAAARLRVHPYAAEKAFGQAQNFSPDELNAVVVRLAELDFALKGGSRLPGDLELERALIDVTGRPVRQAGGS